MIEQSQRTCEMCAYYRFSPEGIMEVLNTGNPDDITVHKCIYPKTHEYNEKPRYICKLEAKDCPNFRMNPTLEPKQETVN